jgi:hypothetical protein
MLDFVDRKFNSDKTSKCKLSIQISLDGFLFGIFDADNVCVAAKILNIDSNNDIENLFADESLLVKRFSAVNCAVATQKSTLIPNNFFNKNKSAEYLKFVCNITDEKIFTHKIKKIGASCIFAIDENIYETVKKHQSSTTFYNQSIPLIYAALNSYGKNMFVFFDSKTIDIVVNNNEKLLLQNSYRIDSINDAIYFAVAVKKQLNIEFDNVYLSGKTNKHDENEFSSFFKQVKLEGIKDLVFSAGIENALRLILLENLCKCV